MLEFDQLCSNEKCCGPEDCEMPRCDNAASLMVYDTKTAWEARVVCTMHTTLAIETELFEVVA